MSLHDYVAAPMLKPSETSSGTHDQPESNVDEKESVSGNPALEVKEQAKLDIDAFPEVILRRIDPAYSFKPFEKNGELVAPFTAVYHYVWEDVPAILREKSEVWAGSEFGSTTWVTTIRLGAYVIPRDESILQALQGLDGLEAATAVLARATGTHYSLAKSRTVGRYIASLLTGGDNHVTLLTAAYCTLFDRLWRYAP